MKTLVFICVGSAVVLWIFKTVAIFITLHLYRTATPYSSTVLQTIPMLFIVTEITAVVKNFSVFSNCFPLCFYRCMENASMSYRSKFSFTVR